MSVAKEPKRIARYELIEEIGRGNMGIVYKARDPGIDRFVAIKLVRLGFSLEEEKRKRFLERFHREARIAGRLSHPHIIAVHDVGFGEEAYIVMEYFHGTDLSRVFELGPLAPDRVGVVGRQLASALDYAHGEGVVHRDIKPANVLYQEGPLIKLVDFGIAKIEAPELTTTGEFIGTPSYMSPEIFSGRPVDGRSDLFSLGVILYQALTGERPFDGKSISRTIYRVLHEEPPAPSSLRTNLPVGWDFVCRKLLAKEPEHRYQSASAVDEDLDRLLRGVLQVPRTRADEPTTPIVGPRRRRRRIWLALAAGALLLATVVTWRGPSPGSPESDSPPPSTTAEVIPPPDAPAAPAAPAASPRSPLDFVARHEHRIGHCTGDLTLRADGSIVFETSRHGTWRWRATDIENVTWQGDTEMELRARSRERGKRDELETFQFTFLRPPLSEEAFRDYRELVSGKR